MKSAQLKVHTDREFRVIITALILLCLSAVGMLEAIERGWIDF